LETVRTVADLRAAVKGWRQEGHSIGLVPTMGALHLGHMALVKASLEATTRTIATIFVNPKQFGPAEDLDSYPRHEAADSELLAAAGVDLLFAPSVPEMYGDDFATGVHIDGLGDIFEGSARPGFFDGVATVVAKLLCQAAADSAFFGEKDYQQLLVIRRMAQDLNIPTAIEGVPTVREADGLAMSSRNAYLTAAERATAPMLFKVIADIATRLAAGGGAADLSQEGLGRLIDAGFTCVDYLAVVDGETLAPATRGRPARVLVAARLGQARLIDNVAA